MRSFVRCGVICSISMSVLEVNINAMVGNNAMVSPINQ